MAWLAGWWAPQGRFNHSGEDQGLRPCFGCCQVCWVEKNDVLGCLFVGGWR